MPWPGGCRGDEDCRDGYPSQCRQYAHAICSATAAAFVHATTEPVRRSCTTSAIQVNLSKEAYLRAFAALPRYSERALARLWLLSIRRRVAADHVRTVRRRPRRSGADWQCDLDRRASSPGPARLVELRDAIAGLSPQRREAFVLTAIVGLAYEQAAELTVLRVRYCPRTRVPRPDRSGRRARRGRQPSERTGAVTTGV